MTKQKRILITGGSGFIGKNIVEYLSQKYEILAPTHYELELTDENVVDAYFAANEIDIVIHSAVKPGHRNAKNSSCLFYSNTRMFFNLMRNSNKFNKMIFLSSGLVYDQRFYQPKMKEEYFDVHVPIDEAGFSKYIAAKFVEHMQKVVELRIFGVFGKYEDYSIRFISNVICKTLFGLPLTVKQNRKFDYIYIEDLIPILEYFIQNSNKYKAYNVTPDISVELLNLAEKIRNKFNTGLSINVAVPGMGMEYSGDNSRLRSEIKSLQFTPIDMAIESLYKWYKDNQSRINKEYLMHDK